MLAGGVGVVAGLGGSFVGVLPMDYGAPHILAASTFFNLGWIAVGLASLDFVVRRDPRFPRWLPASGADGRGIHGVPSRGRREHDRQRAARQPGRFGPESGRFRRSSG